MKRIILFILLMLSGIRLNAQSSGSNGDFPMLGNVSMSVQSATSYGDLRAKVLHVKEKFSGLQTTADKAVAVVLRELCLNYQGRLTPQQYQELSAELSAIKRQLKEQEWQAVLDSSIQSLHEKTDTLDIQQRILDYYMLVPQEQIYLHIDKPYYAAGDTVWLRAHLTDAVTHTPNSRSRYVYVELQDHAADTLVQRIIVRCDSDGIFASALVLPRHLHGGNYTLAAYTQWMRNFPAERFYYQPLRVVAGNVCASRALRPKPEGLEACAPSASPLILAQRKGQLLIQMSDTTAVPMSCVIYGSGNLLVTDYTSGKVLRIDSHSLRPGIVSVALVNRQTGAIVAERQTTIEAGKPQVRISGKALVGNAPMQLDFDVTGADGTPLCGKYSLSVTDADVVKPDSTQYGIAESLSSRPDDYRLSDMLSARYPHIDYGFQTSQQITGRIKGTLSSHLKNPRLLMVNCRTGQRHVFELGDSSRFSVAVDNPNGTVFTLEGTRRSGKTGLVELQIDPQTFPKLQLPTYACGTADDLSVFAAQAEKQYLFNHAPAVDLPEVVKQGVKPQPRLNYGALQAPRGFPVGDPRIDRAASMAQLLAQLGLRTGFYGGYPYVTTHSGAAVEFFLDNFREDDQDYIMNLPPTDISSIEYFPENNPVNSFFGVRPTQGLVPAVLFIFLKDGSGITRATSKDRLSMTVVRHQGYEPVMQFYSPQYTGKGNHRPDYRTTLYWNPKLSTDDRGHATVRFCASDISKRYLVTLEGVSDDGTIIHHQEVVE